MKLNFRELGHGFPIVILHGVFGSSDNWLTVSKSLSEDYKIYLLDQRNHGHSPHSNDFNYDAMVEDLNEFLLDHNLPQIILIGHSMGGKVAMNFALKYPEKVKNLIVVDIGPKYYPPHHQSILEGLNALDLNKIPNRQAADEFLSKYIHELGVRQFLLKNLAREGDGFKWRINLPVITQDIENIGKSMGAEKQFTHPTLFIRGGESRYIMDEDLELINTIFPKSQLVTIPNVGHWVQAEAPKEFIQELKKFLGP